eukprot:348091-Lingulodinium_polyedra.AAC.1
MFGAPDPLRAAGPWAVGVLGISPTRERSFLGGECVEPGHAVSQFPGALGPGDRSPVAIVGGNPTA